MSSAQLSIAQEASLRIRSYGKMSKTQVASYSYTEVIGASTYLKHNCAGQYTFTTKFTFRLHALASNDVQPVQEAALFCCSYQSSATDCRALCLVPILQTEWKCRVLASHVMVQNSRIVPSS